MIFDTLPLELFTRIVVKCSRPEIDVTLIFLSVSVFFLIVASGLGIAALVLNHNRSKEPFACETAEGEALDA